MLEYKIEVFVNLESDQCFESHNSKRSAIGMLTTNFVTNGYFNHCEPIRDSFIITETPEEAFDSVYQYFKTHVKGEK